MITTLFSSVSALFNAIGTIVFTIAVSVASLFGYVPPPGEVAFTPEIITTTATTTPTIATTTLPLAPAPAVRPKPIPKPAPPVVAPLPSVVPPVIIPVPNGTVGTTTLVVKSVPLLSGGTAHSSVGPVPISYLQVINVGKEGALVKGFSVMQNGTAPGEAVIALSTIDDKGGSRGLIGGVEGATPFANGVALAPTDAYLAPGQMRLFTIFATLSRAVTPYVGLQLSIDVTSVSSTATVNGQFPLRGTTWTIAP